MLISAKQKYNPGGQWRALKSLEERTATHKLEDLNNQPSYRNHEQYRHTCPKTYHIQRIDIGIPSDDRLKHWIDIVESVVSLLSPAKH